jgi:hypothetical protein
MSLNLQKKVAAYTRKQFGISFSGDKCIKL